MAHRTLSIQESTLPLGDHFVDVAKKQILWNLANVFSLKTGYCSPWGNSSSKKAVLSFASALSVLMVEL